MRDQRIDPIAGDRFQKGESTVTIVRASSGELSFTFCGILRDAPPMVAWHEPWLPAFRRWAKDAEPLDNPVR